MNVVEELKENLKYAKIARAIPTGIRNIDRMREDIHETVSSVLGLVSSHQGRIDHYGESVDGYQWRIYTNPNGSLSAACMWEKEGLWYCVYAMSKAIQVHRVQDVYRMLGYFIKSMHKLFPDLLEKLKPVIEADSVNPELFN